MNQPWNRAPSTSTRAWTLTLSILCGLLWAPPTSVYGLRVQIRARTQVSAAIRADGQRWFLHGRVVDSAGAPVSHAQLALTWSESNHQNKRELARIRSNYNGRFDEPLPPEVVKRRGELQLAFDGDARYGESRWRGPVQPSLLPLLVRVVEADEAIDSTQPTLSLGVVAVAPGAPPGSSLSASVWLGANRLSSRPLNEQGAGTLHVATTSLGEPGIKRLRVVVDEGGSDRSAVVERSVLYRRRLRVVLKDAQARCEGAMVCASAQVHAATPEGSGAPVVGVGVRLITDERLLAAGETDDHGEVLFRLYAPTLAALNEVSELLVHAETMPESTSEEVARSPGIVVSITHTGFDYWLAIASGVLLLIGLLVWAWRHYRRRRWSIVQLRPGGERQAQSDTPDVFAVRGVVLDAETRFPSPAVVWLQRGEQRRDPTWGGATFSFSEVPAGQWLLHAELSEHRPLSVRLTIPHGGGFDGCQLTPMSHRGWVRERFAEVLGKRARIVVDWSRHTPTGLEDAWMRRQRRGHADIRAAIDHTDRALYGPRTDAKVAAEANEALQKAEGA